MSKLYTPEVASAIKDTNILELSERAKANILTSEDREAIEVLDNFAKEIGEMGKTSENTLLISELIKKTIEPLVFNPDESILADIFNMGTIGEFDESNFSGLAKNTIKVYDAARGGNVPKSYVDPGVFEVKKFALQAETEIDYSDLRRNGWKSIAKMTELARESFEQDMFYRLFAGLDAAIDPLTGDQDIATGSDLTVTNMDIFTRYIRDMSEGNPIAVGLSKYLDPAYKMDGASAFLSEDMKNELNRLGRVTLYDGVKLTSIPTAKKTAGGQNLMPDKRIIGVAGIVGDMNIRGDLRVYETYDNDAEKVKLKFTGFDVDYVIYYLDKLTRVTFS